MLKRLKEWWMAFAHALGWINTRVLLTITYIVLFGIGAIALAFTRKDLLRRKFTNEKSYWQKKDPINHTLEQAKRQF